MSNASLRVLCKAQTCLFEPAFRLFLFIHPVSIIESVRKFFCRVRRFINCAQGRNQAVDQLMPLQHMAAAERRVFIRHRFNSRIETDAGKPA